MGNIQRPPDDSHHNELQWSNQARECPARQEQDKRDNAEYRHYTNSE
jgi:hypothetical protein